MNLILIVYCVQILAKVVEYAHYVYKLNKYTYVGGT